MKTYVSRSLLVFVVLVALGALLAAACGDGDDGDDGPGDTSGEPTADARAPSTGRDNLPDPGPDSPSVTVGSGAGAVDEEVAVDVAITGFGPPGLGAWTVDISYDADVLALIECVPDDSEASNVCNPAFAENTIRIAGAVGQGLEGDTPLATLRFSCAGEGTGTLTVSLDVLADATIGAPQETPVNVVEGEIVCGGAAGASSDEGKPAWGEQIGIATGWGTDCLCLWEKQAEADE